MNAHGKNVDKTYLSIDTAEERGFIHRDYIAHCLRWSHVVKRLMERGKYKEAVILDVGCGRELPLAKLLYSSKMLPKAYIGVDAGKVEDAACLMLEKTGKFPLEVWEEVDAAEFMLAPDIRPNVVVCFEVFEHIEPAHLIKLLRNLKKISAPNAEFFFSTPCWNRTDCAGNHVNEITYEAMGAVLEKEGFAIKNVFGTFASQRDYVNQMSVGSDTFKRLAEYYDSNLLSVIFAPLYPMYSRNCLWECKVSSPGDQDHFAPLTSYTKPWSSSTLWEQLAS